MLGALLLCVHALAAPPDPAWLEKSSTVTNADMLDLMSLLATSYANASLDRSSGLQQVEVVLADRQGRTHLSFLMSSAAVYTMQRQPPGQQTATLLELHRKMMEAFVRKAGGKTGLFRSIDSYQSPSGSVAAEFLRSREPGDVLLEIGFEKGGKNHLYATVHSDHVEFDPTAPSAG